MLQNNYNPDVLTCLANLSSDEVFTPPQLANAILDQLPPEIWRDRNATFLDPVCKTGVFLREIAKRLDVGLEKVIPDKQERINHIFTKQLYGLAITEMTALLSRRSVYCSKTANGKYSVCESFGDSQGNIRFERVEHTWENGRCIFCGASQANYERSEELETHAYQFIHTENPEELFNMKFDVIIGNPPYQLAGGGHGRAAMPIYNLFVEQAKKLSPRYLTMIIPARWYAGGRGLDDFRAVMLNDKRVRRLVDFQHASEVFPGVDVAGGICYFLWDRDNPGDCEIVNKSEPGVSVAVRPLDEFNTLIRSNTAVNTVRKVLALHKGARLSDVVLPSKPFGLRTFYEPKSKGVPCWFIQRIGKRFAAPSDITDEHNPHYS